MDDDAPRSGNLPALLVPAEVEHRPAKVRQVDLHPDEFLVGVAGLTLEEVGLYTRVIMKIYSRGGPIPDDDYENARIFGVDPRIWKRVKPGLIAKGKLQQRDGCLTNRRCELELMKVAKRIADARQGASSRWASTESSPEIRQTSPESSPEIGRRSGEDRREVSGKPDRVLNENGDLADAPAFSAAYANHQPTNHQPTNHQRERDSAASPLAPSGFDMEGEEHQHRDHNANGPRGDCVVAAIDRFTAVLRDKSAAPARTAKAPRRTANGGSL